MASLSRSGGRKKDDAVWQVFEYCADIGKSRCLVKDKNDKPCNKKLNGKNPTNLTVHYTPCISALVLSRLDYCSPCLLDYRGQQSHHCRASRKLQLDSSWICRHAIMSVRLRRSSIGCWCTTTSSSSWLCSCSKHALVSVLYIWDAVTLTRQNTCRYHLRSADTTDNIVPRMSTKFEKRAFCVAGQTVWNSLAESLRSADSILSFKWQLKAHFLNLHFNCV